MMNTRSMTLLNKLAEREMCEDTLRFVDGFLSICEAAGQKAIHWYKKRHTLLLQSKQHHDWVSEADRDVERFLCQSLETLLPGSHFFGEEFGGSLDAPCWVIDPIDGTTNFLYGHHDFVISVALVDQHGTLLSAVVHPVSGRVIYAVRHMGAYEKQSGLTSPLKPRSVSHNELVVGLNLNFQPGVADVYQQHTQWLIEQGHQIRVSGSAAWSLTQVACGELDGAYLGHVHLWDICAAQLICQEVNLDVAAGFSGNTLAGKMWAWPKGSPLDKWVS
ncbi:MULTISPECIES: inositol monophosphatase [unclassified Vibrio]|uniref:Inositol monophosphatase n=1 Tax=Vibrio sp. HB236076 TaxID=3232307 RepID=A0AB39HI00_9VIBR|nr:inositol monophosphatase [Vibrio sp. HB161653]MDP5254993.1 inositol monophosphatase [Vibrio sp. HB161653]